MMTIVSKNTLLTFLISTALILNIISAEFISNFHHHSIEKNPSTSLIHQSTTFNQNISLAKVYLTNHTEDNDKCIICTFLSFFNFISILYFANLLFIFKQQKFENLNIKVKNSRILLFLFNKAPPLPIL
jgi:hypothetical protein